MWIIGRRISKYCKLLIVFYFCVCDKIDIQENTKIIYFTMYSKPKEHCKSLT